MAGIVISGFVFTLCAAILIGLGVFQRKSEKPVGFYNGVKPPEARELTDVDAWNKKHGNLWIAYGIAILLCWVCGLFMGASLWVLVPYFVGVVLPLPLMILRHHALEREYRISL